MKFTILQYENKYKVPLLSMIYEAKEAIGRSTQLKEDLLDIEKHYIKKGDMFWIMVDEQDNVVGCIAYSSIENTSEVFLHRFFIEPSLKNQGLGTRLLNFVEDYLKSQGKTAIRVHLGNKVDYWESYIFYPKKGYEFYEENYMIKYL